MKKLVLTLIATGTLLNTHAQLFSPEALNGAMWGSFIGGMAGGDCHNGFSGESAAIGAGIGLLTGAIAGEVRRNNSYYDSGYSSYVPAPSVSFGYGYGNCGSSAYVYYSPNNYCAPNYYYRPTATSPTATTTTLSPQPSRPNYAVSGTLLGAASGALIGAGNEQAGKGAAIGAAAGLVLGGISEYVAKKHERKLEATQISYQSSVEPAPATSTMDLRLQPQDTRSEITSTPCATSTYTWTARPQIPDAPRVPDAPTF